MKSITSLFAIMMVLSLSLSAQEISFDASIFSTMQNPRFTNVDFASYGAVGQIGFSYNDTLSKKLDYKIGLAYMGGSEGYNSNRVGYLVGDLGDSLQITTAVYDRYEASWISLNLGVRYWFTAPRNGFYVLSEVMPHFFVASSRTESESSSYVEGYGAVDNYTVSDPSDTYRSFNVSWMNSIGYKVHVYKGLGFHFSYNFVVHFGNVVKEVEDGVRLGRGITFGVDYRL